MNDLLKLNENVLFSSLRNTNIFHEYPFVVRNEKSVLQGYIDYLSVGNEIVLIDFKSDYVENEITLIQRYHSQIDAYKKALTLLFPNKDIKTYIYSFRLSKMIEM